MHWCAWRDYVRAVIAAGDNAKAKRLVEEGLKVNPGSADLQELLEQF